MFAPKKLSFRLLCCVMAWIVPLAPSVAVYAQAGSKPAVLRLEYLVPNSAVILSARPRQVLTCEATKMLPVEVASAASLKELGFDPAIIKSVLFSAASPVGGPPSFAVVLELTEPIDLATLSPKITRHTVPGNREGKAYLQSQHPALPSFFWVDNTTLLIAPEQTLEQLLSGETRQLGPFAQELATGSPDDLLLLVNVALLRPLIHMGLAQASSEMPPELMGLLELPNLLQQIRAKINISGAGPIELSCEANDPDAANQVEELIDQTMVFFRKNAALQASKMLASEDTVEQAMGRYMMRITPAWTEQFTPARNGNRFTLFELQPENGSFGGVSSFAVIGVLVGLLLPAVQAAREAARRNASMNNMKQIMLSMHNYHDSTRSFPAHANYSDDGKPLLSWRVHILPYLEEGNLYEQFHLDEPWDSPHNRQLLPLMPEIYNDPSSPRFSTDSGRSHYLAVVGKEFAFDGTEKGKRFASFRDGSSNSIMIVQANDEQATPWTQPKDWEWNKQAPLAGLAPNFHPGIFLAGFGDGHVKAISYDIDVEVFKHMLTIAGGEVIPAQ